MYLNIELFRTKVNFCSSKFNLYNPIYANMLLLLFQVLIQSGHDGDVAGLVSRTGYEWRWERQKNKIEKSINR